MPSPAAGQPSLSAHQLPPSRPSRRQLLASLATLPLWPVTAFARKDARPLLLAEVAPPGIDPQPYLVSEKYDGARALWDGTTLRFRSGRVVPAPAWFTSRLPIASLDGELWLGRRRFDELSAIVRRSEPLDDDWRQVRYMVFEAPGAAGSFSRRAERLRELVARTDAPFLRAVAQRRLADRAQLDRLFDEVVRLGGEGLMLHRADAAVLTGRSDALLKLKPVSDAEATVTAHLQGHGRDAGMLGALLVRTPQGRVFRLGTGFSDAQRRHPPPVGSTVTYRYRDVTPNGLPRFASFLRIRDDF